MGQKVHPIGFRIGQKYTWSSRWFAKDSQYKIYLLEDIRLRKLLLDKLKNAGIAKVEIERALDKRTIMVHVSRPGMVIGRGGQGLEELKKFIVEKLKLTDPAKLELKVIEIVSPDLDAYLLASWAADQLIKRMPARRIMNQVVERAKRAGAKGVRITLAGRIGGAEIARRQTIKEGTIPLHTLKADVDFAKADALTRSGFVGIKVWLCKEGGK